MWCVGVGVCVCGCVVCAMRAWRACVVRAAAACVACELGYRMWLSHTTEKTTE